ncbi:MAG: HAD family hydrolase [Opitutus sp.]|nr:HAD family hydrolase [Opitutus sp.]MCS6247034.1 HAD family hydrolase [Opitutus sp.]MCS6273108.1 HAD family hydrolase [Opitutus sp.]MCS6278900.1 HAD family hydrolase [Opitutus sp.]MCS6298650.1 HAD family hydrolase [Opitutus sp.]
MSTRPNSSPERLTGIRAVIFDLDGTLIDSMPLVMRAFAHALAPFRPDLDMAGIFQRLGGPPERTFLELIGDEAKAGEALRRLESFGFENGSLVQPFDGMRSLLEMLHSSGLRLAIWTGRDRGTTESLLTAHNLAGFFTTVVCGDDLPTHKPHPGGLLEILARLDVQPHQALYSGDADADVLGGAEAGVRTVLIHHGREVETSIATRAWQVVETPPQAYALIAAALETPASTPSS